MRRVARAGACAVWGAGWLLAACETCAREGCDALSTHAGQAAGQTRVAGVVASESDVVGNGCQECGFTGAEVFVTLNVKIINGVSSGYVGAPDTDELSRVVCGVLAGRFSRA
jgi:hypothetical protein